MENSKDPQEKKTTKIPIGDGTTLVHVLDAIGAEEAIAAIMKDMREEYDARRADMAEKLGRTPTYEEWLAGNLTNIRSFLHFKRLEKEYYSGPRNWVHPVSGRTLADHMRAAEPKGTVN